MNIIRLLLIGGLVYFAMQQKKEGTRNMVLIVTGLLAVCMLSKEGFTLIQTASVTGCAAQGGTCTAGGPADAASQDQCGTCSDGTIMNSNDCATTATWTPGTWDECTDYGLDDIFLEVNGMVVSDTFTLNDGSNSVTDLDTLVSAFTCEGTVEPQDGAPTFTLPSEPVDINTYLKCTAAPSEPPPSGPPPSGPPSSGAPPSGPPSSGGPSSSGPSSSGPSYSGPSPSPSPSPSGICIPGDGKTDSCGDDWKNWEWVSSTFGSPDDSLLCLKNDYMPSAYCAPSSDGVSIPGFIGIIVGVVFFCVFVFKVLLPAIISSRKGGGGEGK